MDYEEYAEEYVIASAQNLICMAMESAGVNQYELARRMGVKRPLVTRMLRSGHNLTLKTFARALAACGKKPLFELYSIGGAK